MKDITTSESLAGKTLFKCDNCRKRVAIRVIYSERRVCIECLPEKHRAVFGDTENALVVEPEDEG